MQIAYNLPIKAQNSIPYVLTIGNFDGVHLGHQALLARVNQIARQKGAQSAVITFSNHPTSVLKPEWPTQLLCTPEQKIILLEQTHIDQLFLLEFTQEFSEQSTDNFLHYLQEVIPFSTLILGSDAHIGKDREGNQERVGAIAGELGCEVEYFPDFILDGKRISSSRIRELITQGDLSHVPNLLGRPFSIYAPVIKGSGRGSSIGFPTANISVDGLCLPPLGVYAVAITYQGKEFPGIANLGVAPTMKQKGTPPVLEVHIFDQNIDLYGQFVDIRFKNYIRPEIRFDNIYDLKLQIARDVYNARGLLNVN